VEGLDLESAAGLGCVRVGRREHPHLELRGDDCVGLLEHVVSHRAKLGELVVIDAGAKEHGLELLDVAIMGRVRDRE